MKANELIKKQLPIDSIYKDIESVNSTSNFKIFYPHWIYITDQVKIKLIEDGFKVYNGEWIRGDYGLIIEW